MNKMSAKIVDEYSNVGVNSTNHFDLKKTKLDILERSKVKSVMMGSDVENQIYESLRRMVVRISPKGNLLVAEEKRRI